ncbi:MAG TPA: hypothetical protein ENO09_06790 [bacterium]|nr:hypothetical protein [bacterium]
MRFFSCDFRAVSMVLAVALLAGCATDAPVREDHRAAVVKDLPMPFSQSVNMGRVDAVREVTMADKRRVTGRSVNGNTASGGLAQTMTGVLSPQQAGLELVVRLDNGTAMTVVQAADVAFRKGDRVRVMQSHDGATRVTY